MIVRLCIAGAALIGLLLFAALIGAAAAYVTLMIGVA